MVAGSSGIAGFRKPS